MVGQWSVSGRFVRPWVDRSVGGSVGQSVSRSVGLTLLVCACGQSIGRSVDGRCVRAWVGRSVSDRCVGRSVGERVGQSCSRLQAPASPSVDSRCCCAAASCCCGNSRGSRLPQHQRCGRAASEATIRSHNSATCKRHTAYGIEGSTAHLLRSTAQRVRTRPEPSRLASGLHARHQ